MHPHTAPLRPPISSHCNDAHVLGVP